MRDIRCIAFVLLAASAAASQDLKSIEKELQNRYQNQTLTLEQVYQDKEVVFDMSGAIVGSPIPVCGGHFAVESLRLTNSELILLGKRDNSSRVIVRRSSSDLQPIHPDDKGERQTLHIRSDGHPWDRAELLASIERIQHYPPVKFANPPDAQPAAPMSDHRILYLLPDGPVYRPIDGVTRPHAIDQPDPEYPEAARTAKACGHVQVKAVVREDGTVAYVRTPDPPTGFGFDEKSQEVIRTWKFEPAMLDGHPVKTEVSIDTTFRLY